MDVNLNTGETRATNLTEQTLSPADDRWSPWPALCGARRSFVCSLVWPL